jgi:hypothetical protein
MCWHGKSCWLLNVWYHVWLDRYTFSLKRVTLKLEKAKTWLLDSASAFGKQTPQPNSCMSRGRGVDSSHRVSLAEYWYTQPCLWQKIYRFSGGHGCWSDLAIHLTTGLDSRVGPYLGWGGARGVMGQASPSLHLIIISFIPLHFEQWSLLLQKLRWCCNKFNTPSCGFYVLLYLLYVSPLSEYVVLDPVSGLVGLGPRDWRVITI